jgi:hypothetical protein
MQLPRNPQINRCRDVPVILTLIRENEAGIEPVFMHTAQTCPDYERGGRCCARNEATFGGQLNGRA